CGYACGEPLSTRAVPTPPVEQEGPAMHGEDGLHASHVGQSAAAQHMGIHPEMEHGPTASVHPMAGMGQMSHDMSDPAMAREMEADMRTRFFVSLVLTIPIILYSSLGTT